VEKYSKPSFAKSAICRIRQCDVLDGLQKPSQKKLLDSENAERALADRSHHIRETQPRKGHGVVRVKPIDDDAKLTVLVVVLLAATVIVAVGLLVWS
jgi:hypothetical protein